MTARPVILVVEDDPVLGPALVQRLALEGFAPRLATTGAAALSGAAAGAPAAMISDIRLPDMSGEDVYRQMLASVGAVPTFFLTAFGDVAQAVRLVKAGAIDYLSKPVDVDALVTALRLACADQFSAGDDGLGIAPAIRAVESFLSKAARIDLPVLILGETGVGKEVAVRFLHRLALGNDAPLIALNAAAIPAGLLESTLFGHEKGAFTGAMARGIGMVERAAGGTLFLDEIAELPTDLQAKLLRLIQERRFLPVGAMEERTFTGRLMFATHADLRARIADGRFREDLYYRINVLEVTIPPLRDRPEDIGNLAARFLSLTAERLRLGPRRLSEEAQLALARHGWPGNVRELRNRIERAVALGDTDTIGPTDLFPEERLGGDGPVTGLREAVDRAWRAQIVSALKAAGGNRADAARRLGISRTTLWKRMQLLGL